MTGFAYREHQGENAQMSLEIRSYNNRYLDLALSLPGSLSVLEPEIRGLITARAARGRIEVTLRVRDLVRKPQVRIDPAMVSAYLRALEEVRDLGGFSAPVTLSDVLRFDDLLLVEHERDVNDYRDMAFDLLSGCLAEFEQSRLTEGQATARDIASQLERLSSALAVISGLAPQMEAGLKENVRARFTEMLGDEIELARVYAETAVLLVKYSINEELARMSAHLEGFTEAFSSSEPVGKRLDFLCQEINREINTIGSKSFVLDVSRQVVEMKDALENIREQLRNIE